MKEKARFKESSSDGHDIFNRQPGVGDGAVREFLCPPAGGDVTLRVTGPRSRFFLGGGAN